MPRNILQILVMALVFFWHHRQADAVLWQLLDETPHYKVAYDEQSVRVTPPGRLEVWLRFTPRGVPERKLAAAGFKEKRYRSHLEYYIIDCGEQTSSLALIDIFGVSKTRLKRIMGNARPDPIIPDSALEKIAQHKCPVLDDDDKDESNSEETEEKKESDAAGDTTPNNEKQLQIENLQKKIASKEATAETWRDLGNIYFDTNQPEQAIKAYENALALLPDDTNILNDLGVMYRQVSDFQKALASFEKAFSHDSHNLESLYNCGYVYAFDLNNIPKALEIWRRYLELEATSETARQVQTFIDQYGKPPQKD